MEGIHFYQKNIEMKTMKKFTFTKKLSACCDFNLCLIKTSMEP